MVYNKGKFILRLAALVALLAGLAGPASSILGTAPPAAAALGGAAVSPQGLMNPDGTLDLSTGFQGTLDLRGWEVTLDAERGPILKPALSAVSGWHDLPKDGLDGDVYVLAVVGSDLYVGGEFTHNGDGTPISDNIVRYDTTGGGSWHDLPKDGLNGGVYVLAVVGSDLYVGGEFTHNGDGTPISDNIVRYDTTGGGSWHDLPKDGLDRKVNALAVDGTDLYVGGEFDHNGDATAISDYIVRYDTTGGGSWHDLPNNGLDNDVYVLAVDGTDLYAGGLFTKFPLDAPQLAGGRKAGSPQANSRLQRVRNCGTVRICALSDEAVMRSTI